MPQDHNIISHLKKIASNLQSPIRPISDQEMSVDFSPGIQVHFQLVPESNTLRGEAVLGHMPATSQQETVYSLMQANLLGKEVGNYSLGLNRDGETVVLIGFFSVDQVESEFRKSLEQFLNYAETWLVSIGT